MQCCPPQRCDSTCTDDSAPQTSHLKPFVVPLHVRHSAMDVTLLGDEPDAHRDRVPDDVEHG